MPIYFLYIILMIITHLYNNIYLPLIDLFQMGYGT